MSDIELIGKRRTPSLGHLCALTSPEVRDRDSGPVVKKLVSCRGFGISKRKRRGLRVWNFGKANIVDNREIFAENLPRFA